MFSITPLTKVTTVSKYLALGLFVALPFLGAYVGYSYVPARVVYTDAVVPQWQETLSSRQSNYSATHFDSELKISSSTLSTYAVTPYPCSFLNADDKNDTCYSLVREGTVKTIDTIEHLMYNNTQELTLLREDKDANKIYFKAFFPHSSGCCTLVEYDVASGFFTEQIDYIMPEGESVSPKGTFVLSHGLPYEMVDGREAIEIIDVATKRVVATVTASQGETFNSSGCTYSDSYIIATWINDRTVTYDVFDAASIVPGVCEGERIAQRTIEL